MFVDLTNMTETKHAKKKEKINNKIKKSLPSVRENFKKENVEKFS